MIVPCYNSENFIQETLKSIISQDRDSIQIIVVDDGSTDSTSKILQSVLRKTDLYLYQDNSGVASARNLGISHATGRFISFIDSDDIAYAEKFRKCIDVLNSNSNIVGCGHRMNYINSKSKIQGITPATKFSQDEIKYAKIMPFPFSSFVCKSDELKKVGFFNKSLIGSEDLDIVSRLAYYGEIVIIPEALGAYRLHTQSISHKKVMTQAISCEIVKYLRVNNIDHTNINEIVNLQNNFKIKLSIRRKILRNNFFRSFGIFFINEQYLKAFFFLPIAFMIGPIYSCKRIYSKSGFKN